MRAIVLLLTSLSFTNQAVSVEAAQRPETMNPKGLEIALVELSSPCIFRLSATNISSETITIVRPRAKMVDVYGFWGGWNIRVRGPNGDYFAFARPGALIPWTSSDTIELKPNESVGVIINVSTFTTRNRKTFLENNPGEYTASASYHLTSAHIPSYVESGPVPISLLPASESLPVHFVVTDKVSVPVGEP